MESQFVIMTCIIQLIWIIYYEEVSSVKRWRLNLKDAPLACSGMLRNTPVSKTSSPTLICMWRSQWTGLHSSVCDAYTVKSRSDSLICVFLLFSKALVLPEEGHDTQISKRQSLWDPGPLSADWGPSLKKISNITYQKNKRGKENCRAGRPQPWGLFS